MLSVCHQRFDSPRRALEGLRSQYSVPPLVLKGMIDAAVEDYQKNKKGKASDKEDSSSSRSRSREGRKDRQRRPAVLTPAQGSRTRGRAPSRSPKPPLPRGPPPTLLPGPQASAKQKPVRRDSSQRKRPKEDEDFYRDGGQKIVHGEEMLAKAHEWSPTGDERTDFDPEGMTPEEIEKFFGDPTGTSCSITSDPLLTVSRRKSG